MSMRTRLVAGLCTLAAVVGAVVALRATDDRDGSPEDTEAKPITIERFADSTVVLPAAGPPPAAPGQVLATVDTGHMRLSWADGLPGGTAPERATGYEVRWHRPGGPTDTRLVSTPDTLLTGLTDDVRYDVEVRSVDAYGRRSAPARTSAVPRRADPTWRDGLTGMLDEFTEPLSTRESGSAWHLSGRGECRSTLSGAGPAVGQLIETGCGSAPTVLRARQPLRLTAPAGDRGVLGRVAVVTDAAATGGQLTIDLVAGPADLVGAVSSRTTADRDPTLPAGTVRVVIDADRASVVAAPDVPSLPASGLTPVPAPLRGPGVPHLFEVELTTGGVLAYQDGLLVAVGPVRPSWSAATVLLGMRGPGRTVQVHVAAFGFTGERTTQPDVVEVPLTPATDRVVGPTEATSSGGFSADVLRGAASARVVTTVSLTEGLDASGLVVQLGSLTLPAHPVTAVPTGTAGAALTVAADVPLPLAEASSFVVRGAGTTAGAAVVDSYLEIVPGPDWRPPPGDGPVPPPEPATDQLPDLDVTLTDVSGTPLTLSVVPRDSQLVIRVDLRADLAQWRTGAVAGVAGVEITMDDKLIGALPTAEDGPGVAGSYTFSVRVGSLPRGTHVLIVRAFGMTTAVDVGLLRQTFLLK
jgi:hypothetical protein